MPATANAHLTDTGLGPLYDGIAHLLLSFEDLLPVIALALLGGQSGPAVGRRVLVALPLAWAVGGVAGVLGAGGLPPDDVTAVSLLALGGLTAAGAQLSCAWASTLAVILGLLHGALNGAAIASVERDASALLGIVAAVFLVVALVAAFARSLRATWAQVAVRVAGGWIAAVGLLMLGWAIRAARA